MLIIGIVVQYYCYYLANIFTDKSRFVHQYIQQAHPPLVRFFMQNM